MNRFEKANRVGLLGIGANLFLFCIKIGVGLISRSQGMIADALNSASDIVSSLMTFIGNKIAGKPEDSGHPYGHGKAEYIFSMFISITMLTVAAAIFKNSVKSIINKEVLYFSWWIVVVCVVTIVVKALLYVYTSKIGKEDNNLLVLANAQDHRNDVFVTLSTLCGVIASLFGLFWLDGAVGIGISIWIFYSGVQILLASFKVLMDSDEDNIALKQEIRDYVTSVQKVGHIDSITAKPVGVNYLIVLKISVDGNMTVSDSHQLAGELRYNLRKNKRIADVVIHINPL